MPDMVCVTACTASLLRCVICEVSWASWAPRCAASALCCTVPLISSTEAAVCSRLLAWDSVREARSWLPDAIWDTAVLSWSTSLRTSCTTVRRLSDICCRACCNWPAAPRAPVLIG